MSVTRRSAQPPCGLGAVRDDSDAIAAAAPATSPIAARCWTRRDSGSRRRLAPPAGRSRAARSARERLRRRQPRWRRLARGHLEREPPAWNAISGGGLATRAEHLAGALAIAQAIEDDVRRPRSTSTARHEPSPPGGSRQRLRQPYQSCDARARRTACSGDRPPGSPATAQPQRERVATPCRSRDRASEKRYSHASARSRWWWRPLLDEDAPGARRVTGRSRADPRCPTAPRQHHARSQRLRLGELEVARRPLASVGDVPREERQRSRVSTSRVSRPPQSDATAERVGLRVEDEHLTTSSTKPKSCGAVDALRRVRPHRRVHLARRPPAVAGGGGGRAVVRDRGTGGGFATRPSLPGGSPIPAYRNINYCAYMGNRMWQCLLFSLLTRTYMWPSTSCQGSARRPTLPGRGTGLPGEERDGDERHQQRREQYAVHVTIYLETRL